MIYREGEYSYISVSVNSFIKGSKEMDTAEKILEIMNS